MEVKELIEELQKCNPNAIVVPVGKAVKDDADVVAAEQHNPNLVEIIIE